MADFDSEIIALIEQPRESLSVEYKSWLDPSNLEHAAKILRAILALRNFNGGKLVIGFNDITLKPDLRTATADIRDKFHSDIIQNLISRHASELFEVKVVFPENNAVFFPIIIVPSGIKTPVVVKKELKVGEKVLLKKNEIYMRSLNSNGTPSSCLITSEDWPEFCQIMFDNREADIGRFLRRQLGGLTSDSFKLILESLGNISESSINETEKQQREIIEFLNNCEESYKKAVQEQKLSLPKHGSYEAAVFILGHVPNHELNRKFLQLLDSKNPRFSGWPMWLNSEGFSDEKSRPYTRGGFWEALICNLGSGYSDHIDFHILDPKGRFYIRRALQDDIGGSQKAPDPMKELDFGLVIYRVTEILGTGLAFAKAMGCDINKTSLFFCFRWKGLRGRKLSSWANPMRFYRGHNAAYDDEITIFVTVPLETPFSALFSFVKQIVARLFEVFGGEEISDLAIEQIVSKATEGRF